jgi:hypothetical protein
MSTSICVFNSRSLSLPCRLLISSSVGVNRSIMQRTCCFCISRGISVPSGSRSFGIVPKTKPRPESTKSSSTSDIPRPRSRPQFIRSSPRRLTGYLADDPAITITRPGSDASSSGRPPSNKTRDLLDAKGRNPLDSHGRSDLYKNANTNSSRNVRKPLYPHTSAPTSNPLDYPASSTSKTNREEHDSHGYTEAEVLMNPKNRSSSIRRPLYAHTPEPTSSPLENPISSISKTNRGRVSLFTLTRTPFRSTNDQIHFKGLHHETAIPAFHRPSTPSTPIIKYRDKYLHLRATPSYLLSRPSSPFPSGLPTFTTRHPGMGVLHFGVVASKSSVSPFAVERGRVRKRFKSAVEEVINTTRSGETGTLQDGLNLGTFSLRPWKL